MCTEPRVTPNSCVLWVEVADVPESIRYMVRVAAQGHADSYRQSVDAGGMVVRVDPNDVDSEYFPGFRDIEAIYLKFGGEEDV